MSYMKSAGTSAKGNDRLLKQYGGNDGSSPMARQHYATGGAVKSANPSLNEGLSAAGSPAKKSLARPGRKMPGKGKSKGKEAKTNINVIIAGKPEAPAAGPMPPPPMDGPPMPPPGAGGPPPAGMPMRAKGGRVCKADGGSAEKDDGEFSGAGSGTASESDEGVSPNQLRIGPTKTLDRAAGGKRSDNEAKDQETRRLFGSWGGPKLGTESRGEGEGGRKHGGKVKRAEGGPVMGLSNKDGGAGGASGRLAKIKDYGK